MVRDVRCSLVREEVALAVDEALRVLQPAQLFLQAHADVTVRPDGPGACRSEIGRRIEDPVAEVGLGGGAQTHCGRAAGHAHRFLGRHVGGMHQAPACIYRDVIQQPGHRARAEDSAAVFDLGGLLGDMDVDGGALVERIQTCEQPPQRFRRHRAQGMRRNAVAELPVLAVSAPKVTHHLEQYFG